MLAHRWHAILQVSQEHFLWTSLSVTSALGACTCFWRASTGGRGWSNGVPTRWMYIALLPFHCITFLGYVLCSSLLGTPVEDGGGPLFTRPFLETWDAEPQPASARLIFFSLVILILFAVFTLVLHDVDESDPEVRSQSALASGVQQRSRLHHWLPRSYVRRPIALAQRAVRFRRLRQRKTSHAIGSLSSTTALSTASTSNGGIPLQPHGTH